MAHPRPMQAKVAILSFHQRCVVTGCPLDVRLDIICDDKPSNEARSQGYVYAVRWLRPWLPKARPPVIGLLDADLRFAPTQSVLETIEQQLIHQSEPGLVKLLQTSRVRLRSDAKRPLIAAITFTGTRVGISPG